MKNVLIAGIMLAVTAALADRVKVDGGTLQSGTGTDPDQSTTKDRQPRARCDQAHEVPENDEADCSEADATRFQVGEHRGRLPATVQTPARRRPPQEGHRGQWRG